MVGKSFLSGFGGCLGVLVAIIFVVVGLCVWIASNVQQAHRSTDVSVSSTNNGHRKKPDAEAQSPSVPVPEPQPQRPEHPDNLVVNDAEAIFAAYEKNEVQADSEMKNRWGAVKGQINKIGKDILNNPYVALDVGKEFSIFSVQCMFKKSDEMILANLSPGQTIVIGGKCAGKMGNVLMRECWLYDEGPSLREKARKEAELEKQRLQEKAERLRQMEAEQAKKQAAIEEARWHTWTTADGKFSVKAKFRKGAGDKVTLQKEDGTEVTVSKDALCEADQKWIAHQGWNSSLK